MEHRRGLFRGLLGRTAAHERLPATMAARTGMPRAVDRTVASIRWRSHCSSESGLRTAVSLKWSTSRHSSSRSAGRDFRAPSKSVTAESRLTPSTRSITLTARREALSCATPRREASRSPALDCVAVCRLTCDGHAGRSAAWLARLPWEQEVTSSNLVAPICRK